MNRVLVLILIIGWATPGGAGHNASPAVLTIHAGVLKGLLEQGVRPVSVDLRPAAEHQRGRLPGARSIPLDELERRWAEIPRDRMVVLYCACPEQKVTPAYYFLLRQGYREVFVLRDGLGAWTAHGYPLER
jgi:rhodanese-related sulfurtransferase